MNPNLLEFSWKIGQLIDLTQKKFFTNCMIASISFNEEDMVYFVSFTKMLVQNTQSQNQMTSSFQ